MEELAVGTGITGILAFTIPSSKVIYETWSGIQQVPADVERLISLIIDLGFFMEQLETFLRESSVCAPLFWTTFGRKFLGFELRQTRRYEELEDMKKY